MKHMFKTTLVLLGLILALDATANASDPTGGYQIYGYGLLPCSTYGQARLQPNGLSTTLFAVWLGGYINATNVQLANTYDITGKTDINGLLGWLDNFCRANPTGTFAHAADSLVIFLYPSRKQSADK